MKNAFIGAARAAALKIEEFFRVSPDYQFIQNPAYNADRGPVHIASLRARVSF